MQLQKMLQIVYFLFDVGSGVMEKSKDYIAHAANSVAEVFFFETICFLIFVRISGQFNSSDTRQLLGDFKKDEMKRKGGKKEARGKKSARWACARANASARAPFPLVQSFHLSLSLSPYLMVAAPLRISHTSPR